MKDYIEKFLMLFNKLKSHLNHSLKNLKWLPDAHPEIAELCYNLDEIYERIDRFLLSQPIKSSVVHPTFQQKWDEYGKYYKAKIQEVAEPIREKHYEKIFEMIDLKAEQAEQDGRMSKVEFWQKVNDELPKETGMTFNPAIDNASVLLQDIFNLAYDSAGLDPDGISDQHLGALKYFEDTIGVNLGEINYRWGKVPNLFISENVKKKTDKLIELYNEAAKSYIFGLNVSATAMCRALLEHILIKYYGLPKNKLYNIIALAEKKFKKLKSLNLDKLRKDGNGVMHEYENKSKIEDESVIRYLMTIKFLVSSIPEK